MSVFGLVSTFLLAARTTFASLDSVPSSVDGVLTVYSGVKISFKCSHNNLVTGVTRWSFSTPLDCSETIIDHNPPITTSPCGQFTFENVTEIMLGRLLNSTVVATATSAMSGGVIECRDSTGISPNVVGRVALCVINLPQPPSNITWSVVSGDGGVISWNPVPRPQCSTKQLSYSVTIVQLPQGSSPVKFITTQNNAGISSLQTNSTYFVIVRTKVDTDELVSATASTFSFVNGVTTVDSQSSNTTSINLVPNCSTMQPLLPTSDEQITSPPNVTPSTSGSCSCSDSITSPVESRVTSSHTKYWTNCSVEASDFNNTDGIILILATSLVLIAIISVTVGIIIGSIFTYFFTRKTSRNVRETGSSSCVETTNPVYEEIHVSNMTSSHDQNISMGDNVAYGPSTGRHASLSMRHMHT